MNILICGAGIAGLTAAYWLGQAGHDCTVIEKAPDIRTEGYMIDFGGSGWDVANRMRLIPALEARQHHVHLINFMGKQGQISATIDTRKLYKVADVEGKFMVLNRRDIVSALYEHIKATTRICFDTTIQAIQQADEHVTVTFSDDTTGEFDLVIGADGIHSQVRRMVFGEESEFARYLGYHFAVFEIDAQADIPHGFDLYLEPCIQVSVYPMDDGRWMVYLTMKNDSPSAPPRESRNTQIKDMLRGMGWVCDKIADVITDETYIFYDTITQIVNPNWSKGRVLLIGDAAHCPTLISGQGASMAMAGAYFWAQVLENTASISDAITAFESRLRPDIDRIQSKARDFAPNFVPDSRWRIAIVKFMVRFVDVPIIKQIVGKQFAVKSILTDDD